MSRKGQAKFSLKEEGGLTLNLRRRANAYGRHCVLGLLFFLCAANVSWGQGVNGTLRGAVKDSKGGLVPNAAVTLISIDRGDERQTTTNSEGSYTFTAVAPGKYNLKVEAPNFKTTTSDVSIAPSESRALEVALEVGAPTENVTITGDISQIKTDTGERSDTLTAKQIDNLSIIGRSGLELLRILPGVVAPDPGDPNSGVDRVTFGGGANATANYTVNGIRGQNNSVSIDGSRVVDIGSNNGTMITPNVDMIQEATIKSSNYAAEYGSASVQVSFTTKGGGKDFHGEVYDYFRPGSLQANDRSSASQGIGRPSTSFQYPGGNIGGPLLLPFGNFNRDRDKLFFFVGFEVQRQKPDRGARFGWVPTQAERNGDFRNSLTRQTGANGQFLTVAQGGHLCPPDTVGWGDCDGSGTGVGGAVRNPVPNGNFVPYKDALGSALLNLYPLPNFVPAAGSTYAALNNNYASNFVSPQNRTDLKMRFDYKVSNNTNVYLRLARESESDDSPYGIWWGPSAFELPSHVVGKNLGRSAAANITSVLSPTMTNEVVISGSKLRLDYDYDDPSKVTKTALGVENIKLPWDSTSRAPQTPYASVALINGWSNGAGNMWEPGGLPLFAINDSYSVNETLSKVYNNHTLKFGGLIERATKVQNLNSVAEGRFEFERDQGRTTGNAFANLYTGRINDVQQSTEVPTGHFKFWNLEGYAQDSWKVRSNITVEFGARLALFTNNTEQTGLASVFDPNAYVRGQGAYLPGADGKPDLNKPNGFLTFKNGQIPKGVYEDNAPLRISPRLNIAWDISGKGTTVIRGGAGVFYNRVQGNYQYAIQTIAPNLETIGANSWGAPDNDISISNLTKFNPFNTSSPFCRCVAGGVSQDRNSNVIPRITTLSLSVARRLPFQTVLEVAYVGTLGRHLPQRTGINFILKPLTGNYLAPGGDPAGTANLSNPQHRAAVAQNATAFANLLPFPVFSPDNGGGIQLEEYIGTSNYHSMQLTLNRQLGKSLQYFLTYTFSKGLGTTTTNESDGDAIIDPIDTRGRSYGILPFDRTHILNLSYNYDFPKLARGSFENTFTKALLNGWQMSGITTFQSGHPIRIKFIGAINNATSIFGNFGNYAVVGTNALSSSGVAPLVSSNARTGKREINDLYINPAAFSIPAPGTSGPYQSPFYLRSPTTNNFDVTFFKNFVITESKRLQFRAGFFNVFNEAFANPDTTPSDLGNYSGGSLTLNTLNAIDPRYVTPTCFQLPIGTPTGTGTLASNGTPLALKAGGTEAVSGVCDPTKGFTIDPGSAATFGRIINKHGHRRVELALKFYF
jgi:hypothetical protein